MEINDIWSQFDDSFMEQVPDEDDLEAMSNEDSYFPTEGDAFETGNIFLTNEKIFVEIPFIKWPENISISQNFHRLNETCIVPRYDIAIEHGPFQWYLYRTHSDLLMLDHDLRLNGVKLRIKRLGHKMNFLDIETVDFDSLNDKDKGKRKLQTYFEAILNSQNFRCLDAVLRFFEISPLTFRTRLGTSKFKEGLILKRPKAHLLMTGSIEHFFHKRWLVLKDTYIVVLKPHKLDHDAISNFAAGELNNYTVSPTRDSVWKRHRKWRYSKVMLMDRCFQQKVISYRSSSLLQISNMHGHLSFISDRMTPLLDWQAKITQVLSSQAAQDFILPNRYRSFAPVRTDGQMMFCIDGASYMAAVADGINQAKYEIFITDWWLSPEIFLKRPSEGVEWRLDMLLQKKAEEGVRICIIIYNEVPQVLNLKSAYTEKLLTGLHRNIHVIRHPNHFRDFTWSWSHHEKMVVIDQSVTFMGGIDLCYGRWDRQSHPLIDLDPTAIYKRRKNGPIETNDAITNVVLTALLPIAHQMPQNLLKAVKSSVNPVGLLRSDVNLTSFICENIEEPGDVNNEEIIANPKYPQTFVKSSITPNGVLQCDVAPASFISKKKMERDDGNNKEIKETNKVFQNHRSRSLSANRSLDLHHPNRKFHQSTQLHNSIWSRDLTEECTSGSAYSEVSDDIHYNQLDAEQSKRRRMTLLFRRLHSEDSLNRRQKNGLNQFASQAEKYLFFGKDYVNWMIKDLYNVEEPYFDDIDRTQIPRMPWHDCGCALTGKVAGDFARHFIQSWNTHRTRKAKHQRRKSFFKASIPPVLLPTPPSNPGLAARLSELGTEDSCADGEARIQRSFTCQTQALRSVGQWSIVLDKKNQATELTKDPGSSDGDCAIRTENSILASYVDAIREAEHFIYIENQFFISWMDTRNSLPDESEDTDSLFMDNYEEMSNGSGTSELKLHGSTVKNRIAQALYERILRAYSEKKTFRVYILIPLLAAFEGQAGSRKNGASIHMINKLTRSSLFKGKTALIPKLRLKVGKVEDYISVCSLRTYDRWPDGQLTTELVYIHSKLMVVDDRKVIIGSANINDRSMLGYRDSELAVVAEDTPMTGNLRAATFAGQSVLVGEVARRLRKALMAEHLGVLTRQTRANLDWNYHLLDDPVCNDFFHNVWGRIADSNTHIYEQVFRCLPSNNMRRFADKPKFKLLKPLQLTSPRRANAMMKQIKGNLVRYPEQFLIEEKIPIPKGSVESMAPIFVWT